MTMKHSSGPQAEAALGRSQEFVRRLARRLVEDPHEADDVAQETWLRWLRSGHREHAGLRAWLAASVRGIASNRSRGRARRTHHETAAAGPGHAPDAVEHVALRQEVVAAVLALPGPDREVVILRFDRGWSPATIASHLGLPPSTVRSRLQRALAKLRASLGQESEPGLGRYGVLAASRAPGPGAWALAAISTLGLAAWGVAIAVWLAGEPGSAASAWESLRAVAAGPGEWRGRGSAAPVQIGPLRLDGRAGQERDVPVDPYWAAVRSARAGIQRYVPVEGQASTDLRAKLRVSRVEGMTSPEGPGMEPAMRALRRGFGAPLIVSDEARKLAARESFGALCIHSAELTAEDALLVASDLMGPWVEWEVVQGAVHFDTRKGLAEHNATFSFGIADLTLDPRDFYGDDVPGPVFSEWVPARAPLALLRQCTPGQYFEPLDAEWSYADGAIRLCDTPRILVEAQAWLDRFRSFRVPLPEEGRPGAKQLHFRGDGDARVLAAVRSAGGIGALAPEEGEAAFDALRRFGRECDIPVWGLGWSGGWPFRPAVHAGCLWVLDEGEVLPFENQGELRVDLRGVLGGEPLELVPQPGGYWSERMAAWRDRQGEAWWFVDCVRGIVGQDRWGAESGSALWFSRDLDVWIRHEPLVLDELGGLIAYLRDMAKR